MAKTKRTAPFRIGDRVRAKYDSAVLTVRWISKGDTTREGQLIATERNGYCNPYSDAEAYEAVQ